jgi:hypothetical protein
LCRAKYDDLKRTCNFVESITDSVIFSTPSVDTDGVHFKRLLKWAYSVSVYRTDTGTGQWKEFGSLLKWHALKSETEKPEAPTDFPGFGDQNTEDFPRFWFKLCPWMESVVMFGARSKLDLTRVAHLTSSRGLPSGDDTTRKRSLQKHRNTLESVHDETEEREEILRLLSNLIGRKIKEETSDYTSAAHLSLTTSSSFDSKVKEGGRAKEISESFRSWMEAVPTRTVEGTTLLGRESAEVAGFPRWMTAGRRNYNDFIAELPHDEDGAISSCVMPGESRQDTVFDFENFKYEDPIYGLDEATGYQLHQWAVEEMLNLGFLTGDKHQPDSLQLSAEVYPLIRRSSIGEPGAKSRVVTVGEACVTIFLQPFSHHITGWLRNHPSARSGLTRAAQGFEYVKGLHRKECPGDVEEPELRMLSSDLTTATDFCVHSYSQAMLDGLVSGLDEECPYHRLSNKLLCSSRRVVDSEEDVWSTNRGILMGDPGAKAVLTMHNLCAELEALIRYRLGRDASDAELLSHLRKLKHIPSAWWRHFSCSGDDHAATGPREYLREITKSHSRNGMSVSWPQNFISEIGGTYCEEWIFIRDYSCQEIFRGKFLFQLDYESHCHVDAIKLRLLSPCSKEHEGKDEPNPGIGKAHQISKVLAWLEKPLDLLKKWASWRFSERFSAFLSDNVTRYLPVSLGGLEAPAWHLDLPTVIDQIIDLDHNHLILMRKVLSGESTHLDRRVLSSFASNARARGINADLIGDQVRDFLSNKELIHSINLDEIQSLIVVSPDEFRSWNYSTKIRKARSAGFISLNDAINMIERPYIFRDLLFPDMSAKHGYDPRSTIPYSNKSWISRKRKFTELVDRQVPDGEGDPLSSADVTRIASSVVEGARLGIPPLNLLIPKDVVELDSRPQLRTPY